MDKLELIVKKIDDLKSDSEKKHDQMQDDVSEIKDAMIEMSFDVRRNADDLQNHMKRTELNEKMIIMFEQKHNERLSNLENKFTTDNLIKAGLGIAGSISMIVGLAAGIIKLAQMI